MNKQNRGNYERLQAELEKKYKKREKKKKVKMKVSGGSVKKLQELIIKKTSKWFILDNNRQPEHGWAWIDKLV